MIYQNETIRIVPFERDVHMTEKYRAWMTDPETTKYNSWGLFPYTKKQMEEFVRVVEEGRESKIVWAIEMKQKHCGAENCPICDAGEWSHIGNVALDRINFINRSAELTIVIGEKDARGKGVGATVCRWVIEHAFAKLNLHRIWSGTAATNTAMWLIFEKLKMTREGVLRDGMYLNGAYISIYMYGILKTDQRDS